MIIPSLLTLNKRIAKERIDLAKQMSGWIHIDFLDHTLYLFESLQPEDYANIDFGDLMIEAHCMTTKPEALLASSLPIERILLHHELKGWRASYESIVKQDREAWLVIAPQTPIETLDLPPDLIGVVMMGVEPGQTGQPFIAETFERVEKIKDRYPDVAVTVDGGVGKDNLRLLIAHGADNFVMGNAIFHQTNPVEAYTRYVAIADPLAGGVV